MVIYNCDYCDFNTDKKTNYDRHTKTKKHIKKTLTINGYENNHKNSNVNHVNRNVNRNFECPHCNRNFTTRQAKSRHIKQNICKSNENESVSFTEYKDLMMNMMNKLLDQKDKYSRDMLQEKEKSNQITLKLLESKGNVYNKNSFNVNNTNYVLQFYNYNDADSMNSIIEKFKLTKDEYLRATLTSTYQGALLEKADKVIIEPYMKIEEKRPIHTVDSYRQKALYKDDKHHKWTRNPDTTLKDCFDTFHESAIKQRDKIILENQNYVPESNEDDLYKQIYFIPTDKKEKENVHKKVTEYVHNETKINKSIMTDDCNIIKI
jgi:hypothetical protein